MHHCAQHSRGASRKIAGMFSPSNLRFSIGDYADGDILLNGYYDKSVWKDGKWVWDYDDKIEREDGTELLCRKGVSEDVEV